MIGVGKPRIYIDYISWLHALGKRPKTENCGIGFDVDKEYTIETDGTTSLVNFQVGSWYSDDEDNLNIPKNIKFNYFALLGHNLREENPISFQLYKKDIDNDNVNETISFTLKSLVNGGAINDNLMWDRCGVNPFYRGFSIWEIEDDGSGEFNPDSISESIEGIVCKSYSAASGYDLKWRSFTMGSFYDFPNAADIKLTQEHTMSGLRKQTTKGGVDIHSLDYTGQRMWGEYGAFEIWDDYGYMPYPNRLKSTVGQKHYNLNFSFLTERELYPSAYSGSEIIQTPLNADVSGLIYTQNDDGLYLDEDQNKVTRNLIGSDDFITNCWNRTMGGRLPFLFQKDNTNFQPDQFSICKFDQDSLKMTRVNDQLYNINVKIKEVG